MANSELTDSPHVVFFDLETTGLGMYLQKKKRSALLTQCYGEKASMG